MATSLPLPRGFFDTGALRLSDDRRRQYIEFAESSIRKVFALSDCHKNSWIPVREKKGVAVYRNFGHTRGPQAYKSNVAEVAGKTDVTASLDAVGRAYAAHDDALFQRLMKKATPGCMDAAVLFTVVPRSPAAPYRYIGVKWFAVKTPTPLVAHRDYCVLEVQDQIADSFGNEMLIRVLHSLEVPECPSLETSHGLVRGKMLAGFMYRADRTEKSGALLRAHHVARLDPCGYFPSQWAFKTAESQIVNGLVQIQRILEKQQMSACRFVDKAQWVPNHERLHCAVCSRAFGTFRPRHHCRACGEVICGKCSIFKSVDVPGTTLKNVRLCSICNVGIQKKSAPTAASSSSTDAAARPHSHGVVDRVDGAFPRGAGLHGLVGLRGADEEDLSDMSTSSVTSSSTIAHNERNLMDLYLSATGTPRTPSAYSCASTRSNLSIRSTSSSRSVVDARGSRGASYGHGYGYGGESTPSATAANTTSRFFQSHGTAQTRDSASSMVRPSQTLTPGRPSVDHGHGRGSNASQTPRSYIANCLTPNAAASYGFAATPASASASSSTNVTPRSSSVEEARRSQTPSAQEARMSTFKEAPLDLGYLRMSVRGSHGRTLSNAALPPAKTARVGEDGQRVRSAVHLDVDVDGDVAMEPSAEKEPMTLPTPLKVTMVDLDMDTADESEDAALASGASSPVGSACTDATSATSSSATTPVHVRSGTITRAFFGPTH